MTKVLLIGNLFDDKWMGSLVRSLKSHAPDLQIDILNTQIGRQSQLPDYSRLCSQVYVGKKHFGRLGYGIPKWRTFLQNMDLYLEVRKLVRSQKEKYDVLNIHYLLPIWSYCVSDMKRIANRILLSPWGSDILRAKKQTLKKLAILVEKADYISCGEELVRFQNDITKFLHVSPCKWVHLGFGTEMIDVIQKAGPITRDEAKEKMGLKNRYVVVCGYNGHKAQNHIKIIEEIAKKKDELPPNMILLLPMTYGGEERYVKEIEQKLIALGLAYRLLHHYMTNDELLYVRWCADIFIHAQDTDANSATLAEYLFCRTKIINAAWLTYPHWEKYGKPYYEFATFSSLGEVLVKAVCAQKKIVPKHLLKQIAQSGWNSVGKRWVDFYQACSL